MLKYWLWLTTRKGLGTKGTAMLIRYFGTAQNIYFAGKEQYQNINGLRFLDSLMDKDLSLAEAIMKKCQETGISILTLQDAAYPQRLLSLEDAPAVLYYRGSLPNMNGPVIGVVGTRRSSVYGLAQARKMGYGLSRSGAIVVSGGAAGIDTQALQGALTGGSPVVAVLGCGPDVVYPAANAALFRDVAEHGCLISEYPPGTPPSREHFPVRNRIISGLSMGLLVVEAPLKSGALITANFALDQGRDVFALPVNLGQTSGEGNLQLLRDGAILVRSPWEVLQEYTAQFSGLRYFGDTEHWQGADPFQTDAADDSEFVKKDIDKEENRNYIVSQRIMQTLLPDERKLVQLLEAGPVHIDVLSDEMQQPPGTVLALTTMLEVKGVIRRLPGRRFILVNTE